MKIDLANIHQGFSLCVPQPNQKPYKVGEIWKPQESSIENFDSIKSLYAPDRIEEQDEPFLIITKPTYYG
jgi:hypothetical protein